MIFWYPDNTFVILNLRTSQQGISDGDKGDVIVSNNGATWELDPSLAQAPDAYAAGAVVNGNRVLMLSAGAVIHFNPSVENNYGKAIGFSSNAAILGDPVTVRRSGKLSGFGGLIEGSVYYASTDGTITSVLPTSGIVIEVGVAVSSTELDISFSNELITI